MHEPDSIHPSTEQLRAFSLYQVDDGEVEQIATHLNGCRTCRGQLDDLFAQQALLSQVRAAALAAKDSARGSGRRPWRRGCPGATRAVGVRSSGPARR
jgi:hypothetical protein